jgi:hypothetical protein
VQLAWIWRSFGFKFAALTLLALSTPGVGCDAAKFWLTFDPLDRACWHGSLRDRTLLVA